MSSDSEYELIQRGNAHIDPVSLEGIILPDGIEFLRSPPPGYIVGCFIIINEVHSVIPDYIINQYLMFFTEKRNFEPVYDPILNTYNIFGIITDEKFIELKLRSIKTEKI